MSSYNPDQRIVWYGSLDLPGFGNSEESIMRLDSVNIANELIGTIEEMFLKPPYPPQLFTEAYP